MKFVLVVVAVVVLLWLLRGTFSRRAKPSSESKRPPAADARLRRNVASICRRTKRCPGRGGVFCGDAHRSAFEAAHPE